MEPGVGEDCRAKTTVMIWALGPRPSRSQVEDGTMAHVTSTPGSDKTTELLIKEDMENTDSRHGQHAFCNMQDES